MLNKCSESQLQVLQHCTWVTAVSYRSPVRSFSLEENSVNWRSCEDFSLFFCSGNQCVGGQQRPLLALGSTVLCSVEADLTLSCDQYMNVCLLCVCKSRSCSVLEPRQRPTGGRTQVLSNRPVFSHLWCVWGALSLTQFLGCLWFLISLCGSTKLRTAAWLYDEERISPDEKTRR